MFYIYNWVIAAVCCAYFTAVTDIIYQNPLQHGNWKKYETDAYRIAYPDDWQLDTKTDGVGLAFVLISPDDLEADMFKENINLYIEALPPSETISAAVYAQECQQLLKKTIESFTLIQSTDHSAPIHQIIFTGKQNTLALKWLQRYWVKNKKGYVLTFTAQPEKFASYQTIAEKIMNTFELK